MADTATISVAVIFSVGAAVGIVTVIGVLCCGKNKPKCCGASDKVNPNENNNQVEETSYDDNKESKEKQQKTKNNVQKKKTKKERKRERQQEEDQINQQQPKKENKKPSPKKENKKAPPKKADDDFYDEDYDGEPLDVFISYRRATGSALASLLKAHLSGKGFTCFIDVDKLEAGQFDDNLLSNVKRAQNFVLVLSEGALDKCIGDLEMKDWVHVEIATAIACKKAIIPVIDVRTFKWPNPDDLPEDMRTIQMYNGVRWVHDYQDACIDKVVRFLSGLDPDDDDEEAVPGSIRRLFR